MFRLLQGLDQQQKVMIWQNSFVIHIAIEMTQTILTGFNMGQGIAIFGIWLGSAIAIMHGASSDIFISAAVATVFVALF